MHNNACRLLFVAICLAGMVTAGGKTAGVSHDALDTAAGEFRLYVLERIGESLAAVRNMRERIATHDLPGAQRAWLAARGGWESSEIVTSEYAPDLDRAIDAWPDAERGFHAIEARLFGAHSTDALAAAEELATRLAELEHQLHSTTLTAQRLLNGAARLTYEIGEDKAGGGESPFSGNSLAEIGANLSSIGAMYRKVLAPAVRQEQTGVSKQVSDDLERLQSLVAASNLSRVDQTTLRAASESLASDLGDLGRQLGLQQPSLAN